jgi:lysophospholipase L1-like esterase
VEAFENTYREILTDVKTKLPNCEIVLLEPFLIPVDPEKDAWRVDLDPKIAAVRKLSREFGVTFIPFDGLFQELCAKQDPALFSADGVHPNDAGHAFIAQEWLKRVL